MVNVVPFPTPDPIDDLDGVKITEDVIARLFVQRFAGRFVYDHDRGAWYEFDGSIWRRCGKPIAFQELRRLAREVSGQTQTQGSLQKVRFVKGAEEFARGDDAMARTSESWNTDPFLLGTPDGTVNLATGRLREAKAGDYINRATAVAPSIKPTCPIWLRFLHQATGGDADLIRFLQQMCGYALTGDTREQALFFIHGPGGNGKGVFLNTLNRILADYATTAAMDVLTNTRTGGATTDLAMLNGARLVSASENEEGQPWAEARIKRMTGGDPLTARFMRQDNVTFTPVFKLVVAGNYQPTLKAVDEAMRRRFNMIPFTIKPDVKDVQLETRLMNEWPGILRWMIDGCGDWLQHGLIRPAAVERATKDYFDDQDTLTLWLDMKCNVDRANKYLSEASSTLFASWKPFAIAMGELPGSQKTLSEALEKAGFRKKRDKHGVKFHGVELKPQDSEAYG